MGLRYRGPRDQHVGEVESGGLDDGAEELPLSGDLVGDSGGRFVTVNAAETDSLKAQGGDLVGDLRSER